jgi:Protein of unknown function (DUF3134)
MAALYNPALSNPALSEEPRNQAMRVIPLPPRESLLGWLESSGRLRFNEESETEPEDLKLPETLDDILEPEIYAVENEEE